MCSSDLGRIFGHQSTTTASISPLPRVHWQPPPADLMKINFDEAIFSEVSKSSIGVVVRDRNGLVLASLLQQVPQAYSLEVIEALAASKALQFASDIGITEAVLEEDSQVLRSRLINDRKVLSYSGLLIDDVQCYSHLFNQLVANPRVARNNIIILVTIY